jgi:hypothetical protein
MSYQKPSVAFHELLEDDSLFQAEYLLDFCPHIEEDEEPDPLVIAVHTWQWADVDGVGYMVEAPNLGQLAGLGPITVLTLANGIMLHLRANYKTVHEAWLKYRARERQEQDRNQPYLKLHKN